LVSDKKAAFEKILAGITLPEGRVCRQQTWQALPIGPRCTLQQVSFRVQIRFSLIRNLLTTDQTPKQIALAIRFEMKQVTKTRTGVGLPYAWLAQAVLCL